MFQTPQKGHEPRTTAAVGKSSNISFSSQPWPWIDTCHRGSVSRKCPALAHRFEWSVFVFRMLPMKIQLYVHLHTNTVYSWTTEPHEFCHKHHTRSWRAGRCGSAVRSPGSDASRCNSSKEAWRNESDWVEVNLLYVVSLFFVFCWSYGKFAP